MPTPGNALNITAAGLVKFDGTATFTGVTTTNHDVLVGAASNGITNVGPGSAGQVLQSGGASADPAYSTATYPSTATGTGKHLYADGTNWVASTPTFANIAGTAGKVLISDGTNFVTSTPTFPNASATSRKIIVSDGTNWVASTETWATPGTSGNVLTSDGTNWISSTSGLITVAGHLTSAQIKALHATPIQLIAAPGTNKVIIPIRQVMNFNYAGTNAFTNGGTVSLYYSTTVNLFTNALSNADMIGTVSRFESVAQSTAIVNTSTVANLAINAYNSSATEFAGNAAGDNTVSYYILYYILDLTL